MGVKPSKYSDLHPGGDARRMNGESMRVRQGIKAGLATMLAGSALATAIVMTAATGAGAASSAPGVTANSITVGTISTQTGVLASNFGSLIYGEKAYFDYINAQGGVNGRKIDYQYALDDGGNPTTFNQLANTLINQDHVFAVTGVGTAFFSPSLFVQSGIPTYGYNVTGNWAPAAQPLRSRRVGAVLPGGGAVGGLSCPERPTRRRSPSWRTASQHPPTRARPSRTRCSPRATTSATRTSRSATRAPRSATDVQRMRQAGSNMVVSCMDVQGNVTMARAIKQYGLHRHPVVVQRQRPADARAEPEPHAGDLLQHLPRALHGSARRCTRV